MRFEAFDLSSLDLLFDELLDLDEVVKLLGSNERDRGAAFPSTAGAADTVDVVFCLFGKVKIHHLWKLVNIDSARGDIRGDKDRNRTIFKTIECSRACALALIPMNGRGADSFFLKKGRELVRAMLRAREDKSLLPLVALDEPNEGGGLICLINGADELRHRFCGGVSRAD